MSEINKEEMRERLGNIDQIRDIIFGAQLREYSSRFDKIESDLSLLQQEMRDRLEQIKNHLSSEIRASVDSTEKKLKSLSLTAKEESADIRQQLDRTNKKFSNSIEALDETIDTQTASLREELLQTRENLQEDFQSLRTHVFEELDRRFSILRDVKMSKDDMAEILFEFGMRLKGTEFIPEIRDAVDNKVYAEVPLLEQNNHE